MAIGGADADADPALGNLTLARPGGCLIDDPLDRHHTLTPVLSKALTVQRVAIVV